eukprot:NODE_805_length_3794_cov_0.257375.p2 type:complete len:232 gc:universal NODE_805_length_3794_cov_0.257375:729-1424(+)
MRLDFDAFQNSEYEVIGSLRLTKYYESKFQQPIQSVTLNEQSGFIEIDDEKYEFSLEEQTACEIYDDMGKLVGPVPYKINLKPPTTAQLKKQREKNQLIRKQSKKEIKQELQVEQVSQSSISPSKSPAKTINASKWMYDVNLELKSRIIHLLAISNYSFGDLKLMTKASQPDIVKQLKLIAFSRGLIYELKKDAWHLLDKKWPYSEAERELILSRLMKYSVLKPIYDLFIE